jgi:hypothetical protein
MMMMMMMLMMMMMMMMMSILMCMPLQAAQQAAALVNGAAECCQPQHQAGMLAQLCHTPYLEVVEVLPVPVHAGPLSGQQGGRQGGGQGPLVCQELGHVSACRSSSSTGGMDGQQQLQVSWPMGIAASWQACTHM